VCRARAGASSCRRARALSSRDHGDACRHRARRAAGRPKLRAVIERAR
jgi:hypothetical protein